MPNLITMKRILVLFLGLALVNLSYGQKKKSSVTALKTTASKKLSNTDSVSYALGMLYGKNLKKAGVDELAYQQVILGVQNAIENKNLMLNDEQAQKLTSAFFASKKEMFIAKLKVENQAFLTQNAKNPQVKTTASGLQYEVLRAGTGKTPNDTTRISAHYIGKLIDGSEFDNSYKRNEPLELMPTQVIKGWTEGLKLMSEGAKYRFFIPYNLAYGENGQGNIPPYSTLIFDVELLKVQ